MSKNDDKIILLKKQIEVKKERLSKVKKFSPETNCILILDEKQYNINTLQKNGLIELLIKLNTIRSSVCELCLEDVYSLCGFSVKTWMDDVKQKLEVITYKEELNKLKQMESKLDKMLSEDKKVELELEDIEKSLEL